MHEVPRRIKRLVREWAGIAHERDLRNALSELRVQFDRWDRGEIDSFELNDLVHRFHQDTLREYGKSTRQDTLNRRLPQRSLPAFLAKRSCRANSRSTSPD